MSGENDAFTAGIRPGGLTSTTEVLVLLCCILAQAGQPVSFRQLNDALQGQELVNYFEFANMIEKLRAGGYAVSHQGEGGELFTLTELGRATAKECRYNIPASVLERAGTALRDILALERRQRENDVDIWRDDDGWQLMLTINDRDLQMMRVLLLLPDEESCLRIKRRFLSDPTSVYTGILDTLSGDGASAKKDNG